MPSGAEDRELAHYKEPAKRDFYKYHVKKIKHKTRFDFTNLWSLVKSDFSDSSYHTLIADLTWHSLVSCYLNGWAH